MEDITLSSKEFKALSSENRVKMLKILKQQNHTLTEISKKLGLSSPSSKQHLEILKNSQLVELIDEGRKWKYYSLTRKGKKILESKESQTQVFILLSVSSIAFVGLLAVLLLSATQITMVASPMQPATVASPLVPEGVESAPAIAGGETADRVFNETETTANILKTDAQTESEEKEQKIQTDPETFRELVALTFFTALLGIVILVLRKEYLRIRREKI